MEPHRRDEHEEEMMEGMIRGGTADVTHLFLKESGDGDDSLGRRDEEQVEGEADGEDNGSDDGEADGSGENIRNSGEVHIYIN